MDYLLYNARESGYTEIVIVIGEKDYSIKEYYGEKDYDNQFKGLNISYAVQPIPAGRIKPLGTADALMWGLKAKNNWSGKRFTVCNSDNLYSRRALKLMLEAEYPGALIDYDRSALEFEASRIEKFVITLKNKEGYLVDIIEKPIPDMIEKMFKQEGYVGVSMNIFSLEYNLILPVLEQLGPNPQRDEKELPEAVKILAAKSQNSVYTYPLAEHVPDLTSKNDIVQVQQYLEKHFPEFSF